MTRTAPQPTPIRALVVMGVAGSGKSTVGRALADLLGWTFVDADDHHPEANVAKIRTGTPLTDVDRAPWLAALRDLLAHETRAGRRVVLACSALKHGYRRTLARCDAPGGCAPDVVFVWLDAPDPVLRGRLQRRRDHFAGSDLLSSQLRDLEPDRESPSVLRFDAASPVPALVEAIVDRLSLDRR